MEGCSWRDGGLFIEGGMEGCYVILRGRDLVMIGLGLLLNAIFCVNSATTSYSVPAWVLPFIDVSSFVVGLCLLRTANGFSNATTFPAHREKNDFTMVEM